MQSKSAIVGAKVQARYNDEHKGVIVEVINKAIVVVRWQNDVSKQDHLSREEIKYLVKDNS